jgi:hypothetical protein
MACARGCCDTQAEHYRSLVFGSSASRQFTRTWDDDTEAYRTLRKEGLQPPRVGGSHQRMMRAETREQVERDYAR